MKSSKAKKIATWIVVPLMAAIFILDIITVALCNHYCERYPMEKEDFSKEAGDDRIHFLNTGNSDAILLESNGHYALVDSGEGNRNPRRKTAYQGYEQQTVDYILKVAADENGVAHLDFVLGTHGHYDHIGAFPAILHNSRIQVDKAFFKGIDSAYFSGLEKNWGMEKTYSEILDCLSARGLTPTLPPEQMTFGDFELYFCNLVNDPALVAEGENAESIGIKVVKGNKSAFLAADITRSSGTEQKFADWVGDVDLLKAGHHGYYGSSSMAFLRKVKPDVVIVPNQLGKVYPNVKWNFTMVAHCPFFATYDNDGIIATFTDNGELLLTNHIHG